MTKNQSGLKSDKKPNEIKALEAQVRALEPQYVGSRIGRGFNRKLLNAYVNLAERYAVLGRDESAKKTLQSAIGHFALMPKTDSLDLNRIGSRMERVAEVIEYNGYIIDLVTELATAEQRADVLDVFGRNTSGHGSRKYYDNLMPLDQRLGSFGITRMLKRSDDKYLDRFGSA